MILREENIGGCRLILGDSLEVMPTLGAVGHVICDPPYEEVMQSAWRPLSELRDGKEGRVDLLPFAAIDDTRQDVALAVQGVCAGWFIAFCMAEGVRAWRDAIEASGMKYKRAMVWVKPDAMPQFNGQGPSVGHEMMVSAWNGKGHSKWNGGGRPGTFTFNKNTPGGAEHPTQKPLPLMERIVTLFSSDGEIVLDPFMGSGTTGVACVKTGRKFIGIEKDPKYFDVAVKRIREARRQPDLFIRHTPAVQEGFDL